MQPRLFQLLATPRAQASFQLWAFNVLVGTLIGTSYLVHIPADLSFWGRLFVPLALVSTVATLALVPGLIFALLCQLVSPARLSGGLQAFVGAFFLALLYADTRIYNLLRYHFNSAVLNVMWTRGSEDAVQLGASVWLAIAVILTVMTAVQFAVWRWALTRAESRVRHGQPRRLLELPLFLWLMLLLPVVFAEKTIYAAADYRREHAVMNTSKVLPLYSGLRLGRYLPGSADRLPEVEVLPEGVGLAWPHEEPRLDPAGPRPNLLFIVLDSWRQDMLAPDVTPRLWHFATQARRFEDHFSGGNGTRFALFSMLYGLHGSYWFPALAEGRGPLMLAALDQVGYETKILSSASMAYPEFRSTAWVDCQEAVEDSWSSRLSWEKDELVAGRFEVWLEGREERRDSQPFFAFLLLDTPHQPYQAPAGGPFQPAATELDYLRLSGDTDEAFRESLFNLYRNAVHHADRVAGRVIDALARGGYDENTLVIITGDHGEEFHENGYWGHTSNFTPEQVAVPFLMRGPGVVAGLEQRPTSHLDVAPTILELLGADPAQRASWCLGENLLAPPASRVRTVAAWDRIGLWTVDGILNIPLDPGAGDVEVLDQSWQPYPDPEQRCRSQDASLLRLAEECTRFLRQL
ncbi:MAG: sulfatase-like hydrolase/transferase [Planctomycetota bacterium]|nr:sulfatase-like hydrolase/transferase [Planctomycetota bacterium]